MYFADKNGHGGIQRILLQALMGQFEKNISKYEIKQMLLKAKKKKELQAELTLIS